MEPGPPRCELYEDGHRAVVLRRGLREEPVRNFPLNHHAPELELREAVEALDDQRRRDVVREIRDELARVWRNRGQIKREGVAEVELDVRPAGESFAELLRER